MAGVPKKPCPLGKRDDQRVRRNETGEDGLGTDQYDLEGEVLIPWAVFDHSFVQGLWKSLEESVNRKFYEPSDWQYARLTLHMWDMVLMKNEVPSAMMIASLDSMLSKMLVTEADRRRLKIEAKRQTEKNGEVVDAATLFKQRFEKQREASSG